MAVPRSRLSNRRKNMRRAHHAKKAVHLSTCQNCKSPRPSHQVCGSCGHYRGMNVAASGEASPQEQA